MTLKRQERDDLLMFLSDKSLELCGIAGVLQQRLLVAKPSLKCSQNAFAFVFDTSKRPKYVHDAD